VRHQAPQAETCRTTCWCSYHFSGRYGCWTGAGHQAERADLARPAPQAPSRVRRGNWPAAGSRR